VAFLGNYLLYQLNNDQYDYFLLCLTYESILNYLDNLENDPLIKNSSGKLLVDQLLVTGNGRNRFITCDFRCGEIILSTAKNIIPDKKYKDLTIKLLQQNYEMLECSILSDHQRDLIMEGQSF
jgi:hypothetical protein